MNNKINAGIVGYGNVGKGIELALRQNPDFHLVGIFSRRDIGSPDRDRKMLPIDKLLAYKDKIDVLFLCYGSASDLPLAGPVLAKDFHTVDSYDNHSQIPEYFDKVDKVSQENKKVNLISVGWDPGLFSINRLIGQSIIPKGKTFTFWGPGVSQGHSEAIRKIKGVKDGIQYTIPVEEGLEKVRQGDNPDLETRDKHTRVCYVVVEDERDCPRIEEEIKTMENYFSDYITTVHFVTEEELKKNHAKMPHGGFVIRTGQSDNNNKFKYEFNLSLESNPEFTASVLVAYGRAVYRLAKENRYGAFTVFDIPLGYLSPKSPKDLRRELL